LAGVAERIRRLDVGPNVRDLSFLSELAELEDVSITGQPLDAIDFARLPRLRKCMLVKVPSLGRIGGAAIEDLTMFEVRVRDLSALRGMSRIRRLHLNDLRQLASLEGVQGLPIEEVQLMYLRNLRSVAALAAVPRLTKLEIVTAKSVDDLARIGDIGPLRDLLLATGASLSSLEPLGSLRNLERLWLHNREDAPPLSLVPLRQLQRLQVLGLFGVKGATDLECIGQLTALRHLTIERGAALPSLTFLRPLKSLRELCLRRTRITDGNLGIVLELPQLTRVYEITPALKHYSHSLEELRALLQAREETRRGPARDEGG
jgi:hypothetical protein